MEEDDIDWGDYPLHDDCPWCGTLEPQGTSFYTWEGLTKEGFDPEDFGWTREGV